MSYPELPEFSCWIAVIGFLAQVSIKFDYLHIVFPYDDTLSVRGTTTVNAKNRLQEFPLSLYQPDCILLCFLLRKVNKNLVDNEVTYYEIRFSVFYRHFSAV